MSFRVARYRRVSPKDDFTPYRNWHASLKIDGWQVIWLDGKLYTKSFKQTFDLPHRWRRALRAAGNGLAGELVIPNEPPGKVRSLLRESSPHWSRARLFVFDSVRPTDRSKQFKHRMKRAHDSVWKACKSWGSRCPIKVVKNVRVRSHKHVLRMLKDIKRIRGEGLVLSDGGAPYGSPKRIKIRL